MSQHLFLVEFALFVEMHLAFQNFGISELLHYEGLALSDFLLVALEEPECQLSSIYIWEINLEVLSPVRTRH